MSSPSAPPGGRLVAPDNSVLARFPRPYLAFLVDLARIPWPAAREPLLRRHPLLWHLILVRGPHGTY